MLRFILVVFLIAFSYTFGFQNGKDTRTKSIGPHMNVNLKDIDQEYALGKKFQLEFLKDLVKGEKGPVIRDYNAEYILFMSVSKNTPKNDFLEYLRSNLGYRPNDLNEKRKLFTVRGLYSIADAVLLKSEIENRFAVKVNIRKKKHEL